MVEHVQFSLFLIQHSKIPLAVKTFVIRKCENAGNINANIAQKPCFWVHELCVRGFVYGD